MIDLLTDCLAVYRITRILTTDRIGQPYRDAMERRGEVAAYYSRCDWCTSAAVAFGVAVAGRVAPRAWRPVAQALAFSTIAGLIAEKT